MKGKYLVIGLVLFTVAAIVAIYFFINAEIKKGSQGMEQSDIVIEQVEIASPIDRAI